MSSEDREFYILDARCCVGDCALWWRPNAKGYTCNLKDAGLYTLSEASSQRASDVPVHMSIAQNRVVHHVEWDHLRQAGIDISSAQNGVRTRAMRKYRGSR